MSKTILILGASYAGLTVAHSLLKKTFTSVKDYRVILVSPTTHQYWNVASPRAIVPGQMADGKFFGDIRAGFRKYPSNSFEFIHGTATTLEPKGKTVTISTESGEKNITYNILIITTGTRTIGDLPEYVGFRLLRQLSGSLASYSRLGFHYTNSLAFRSRELSQGPRPFAIQFAARETALSSGAPIIFSGVYGANSRKWKSSPKGYEATRDILHSYQKKVASAKTIVIGGAGPTGVEVAGELGFEYGKTKEISLITSAPEICADCLTPATQKFAKKELTQKLHVKIIKNIKIQDSNTTAEGKTVLTLSNGETKIVDLYLPTVGVLPNSEFIPRALLSEKGRLKVNNFLKVKEAEDVWAAGDIVDIEPSQIVYAEKQASWLAKNLDLVLKGKKPLAYKYGGDRVLAVTLGRSRATARSGNKKIPSIIIWWFKGRDMGTSKMAGYLDGSKF